MVIHRPGVALEALCVLHRLHFPLYRLTDTVGNRADKQEASGHRDPKMMDVYDYSLPTVSPSAE